VSVNPESPTSELWATQMLAGNEELAKQNEKKQQYV
jgi:hypothetical protein